MIFRFLFDKLNIKMAKFTIMKKVTESFIINKTSNNKQIKTKINNIIKLRLYIIRYQKFD